MRTGKGERGGWFGVVTRAAAVSQLTTLSFVTLCLCADDPASVQRLLEGCGPAAQLERAVGAELAGEACLGPCVDVRMLAAGPPGDDRPPVVAALVESPQGPTREGAHLSPLRARSPDRRPTAGHLDFTILRC